MQRTRILCVPIEREAPVVFITGRQDTSARKQQDNNKQRERMEKKQAAAIAHVFIQKLAEPQRENSSN
jgi:hypothetical protein